MSAELDYAHSRIETLWLCVLMLASGLAVLSWFTIGELGQAGKAPATAGAGAIGGGMGVAK